MRYGTEWIPEDVQLSTDWTTRLTPEEIITLEHQCGNVANLIDVRRDHYLFWALTEYYAHGAGETARRRHINDHGREAPPEVIEKAKEEAREGVIHDIKNLVYNSVRTGVLTRGGKPWAFRTYTEAEYKEKKELWDAKLTVTDNDELAAMDTAIGTTIANRENTIMEDQAATSATRQPVENQTASQHASMTATQQPVEADMPQEITELTSMLGDRFQLTTVTAPTSTPVPQHNAEEDDDEDIDALVARTRDIAEDIVSGDLDAEEARIHELHTAVDASRKTRPLLTDEAIQTAAQRCTGVCTTPTELGEAANAGGSAVTDRAIVDSDTMDC